MRNKLLAVCLIFLFVILAGCIGKERLYYSAPLLLSEITREMKSPGFWISHHPFADKTVLDNSQIELFNRHIRNDLNLTWDITGVGKTFSGEELTGRFKDSLASFSSKPYYLETAEIADKTFLMNLEKNMRIDKIQVQIEFQYGMINAYADQRILPVKEGLYEDRGDIDFDELQNSSFDLGTPLAILHESRDGRWLYVIGPSSDGWVEKNRVSIFNFEELKQYLGQPDFCVVISAKADVFLNPELTEYHDYVRMGARFPLGRIKDSPVIEIVIPYKEPDGRSSLKKAYIKKESVSFGYLAYTPRNIIDQAFKLLNAPYSWGGANGEQDCSGFLQQVFATVGIFLPRNSSAQAETGVLLAGFKKKSDEEKIKILSEKAAGGVTLIYMDGHIMLYLGMHEGRPYVIHDIWAYRQLGLQGDEGRVIGRVVVSGLNLGEDSVRGSLLKRVVSIRSIVANE